MPVTMIRGATIALILCSTVAARPPDEHCPRELFDPTALDRPVIIASISEAPLVVVGVISGVQDIGSPVPAHALPELLLECVSVTVSVENVLKGPPNLGRDLSFYYYMFSKYNSRDLGPPKYIPVPGTRRMFFLTYDQKALRSVGDVRDYTLRVLGGFHDDATLKDLSFGRKVATVLLTPGSGGSRRDFAHELNDGAFVSDSLVSKEYTNSLLKRLASADDVTVRDTARELLQDRTSQDPP
ncbi:MAG TPA: hypothetical protein VFA04_01600 [Bryobacteraceae bacterium]|nr:hypothetical protein [Bryobacteraceae bacterium]